MAVDRFHKLKILRVASVLIAIMALMVGGLIMSNDARADAPHNQTVMANKMAEWSFTAHNPCADPFNTITLDAVFKTPQGETLRVPAFWAGGSHWKVRYASPEIGVHHFRTECSDTTDAGLNGVTGYAKVVPYIGDNPLYKHGPIRVATAHGGRYFEHVDGKPFLWLGDTWWFGLCKRMKWPEDIHTLAEDRKAKGFNVIQIVAGLYPELPPLDPSCENEAGLPWEPGFTRVRPEYFDLADRRLEYLVESGFSPCIVGAWGYFMPEMGPEKLEKHWRYLIARYGALPAIWCIAGEVNLPYYYNPKFPFDDKEQAQTWMQVVRYVREHDPYRRPLTVHPTGLGNLSARGTADVNLLDYDMLQTGHGGLNDLDITVKTVTKSYTEPPAMPVVQGEVNYECLVGMDYNPDSIQRLFYWCCMLSGTTGYTYGGNGIWQVNLEGQPKITYGNYPVPTWQKAMHLPGSTQLGVGHRLLDSLPWQRMSPHPEWAQVHQTPPLELDEASWIWYPEGSPAEDAPVAKRWFRRSFQIPQHGAIRHARLKMTADDRFTVWLNGKQIGSHGNWSTGREFDLSESLLNAGWNSVAVEAENSAAPVTKNPAGLLGILQVEYEDGTLFSVKTDALWKSSNQLEDGWNHKDFADTRWSQALVAAKYGEGPWGKAARGGAVTQAYCGDLAAEFRLVYLPKPLPLTLTHLDKSVHWKAMWIHPATGAKSEALPVTVDVNGTWRADAPPAGSADWLLLLQRKSAG